MMQGMRTLVRRLRLRPVIDEHLTRWAIPGPHRAATGHLLMGTIANLPPGAPPICPPGLLRCEMRIEHIQSEGPTMQHSNIPKVRIRRRNRFPNTPEGRKSAAHWAQVFRDNAERYCIQRGKVVPPPNTPEYTAMYNEWVEHMRND